MNDAERALILVVNGFLYVVYFLAAHLPALIALIVGVFIAWRYDGEAARRAGGRARRYGRGEVGAASSGPRLRSALTIGAWTAAALLAPTGVEAWIGAGLWAALALGLHFIPAERSAVLFRHKLMLLGYAGLVLAFRAVMGMDLSGGAAIAAVTGRLNADAADLFESVRWAVLPYLAILTWVLYPAGFVGLLWQRYNAIRPGLSAQGRAEDVVRAVVTRGEEVHDTPAPPRADRRP